jgi:hypothetical protein
MEIVEEHRSRLPLSHHRERGADRLEERCSIGPAGWTAELGQQHPQICEQGAAFIQPARLTAQVGAQRRDKRPVWRRRLLRGIAPQEE